jgi:hypothetical protein
MVCVKEDREKINVMKLRVHKEGGVDRKRSHRTFECIDTSHFLIITPPFPTMLLVGFIKKIWQLCPFPTPCHPPHLLSQNKKYVPNLTTNK